MTTKNFADAALADVGETHGEGVEVGSKLLWFLTTSLKMALQSAQFLPGVMISEFALSAYRMKPQLRV
jgi:hypothetical protein